MMNKKELDGEDKATVLCAILRALGKKDAEVLWICSDKSDYSPMIEYPSKRMFDYALAYIPSDSLYLDPSDPGGEVGILSEILYDRLACHPMSDSIFLTTTPKTDRFSNVLTNLKLIQDDAGNFGGDASIEFHNQAAIEIRRNFHEKGGEEVKKIINKCLFRDFCDAVKSYSIIVDSAVSPSSFTINCKVEIPNFAGEDEFELPAYPGPSFEYAALDDHPPRKYPVYFPTKDFNVYSIEWKFKEGYKPINFGNLNSKADGTLLKSSIAVDYDSLTNTLALRRQYKMTQKMFRPDFIQTLERYIQDAKKCDISTVTIEKF